MRDIDDAVGERAELDGCHVMHELPSLAELRAALEAGRNRPEVTPKGTSKGARASRNNNARGPAEEGNAPESRLESALFPAL